MVVRFAVRVVPRAGADRVDGVVDGELRTRVAAAPADGAANGALVRLLAAELGVGRTSVRVIAGATARRKTVEADLDPERVTERWPGLRVGL